MIKVKLVFVAMSLSLVLPTTSFASNFGDNWSQDKKDDCAIWLCLPAGFGQGCGGAKGKFKDRIKDRKPPMPSWGSCSKPEDKNNQPYTYQANYKTYSKYFNDNRVYLNDGINCPASGVIRTGGRDSYDIGYCTVTVTHSGVISTDGAGFPFSYEEKEEQYMGKPLSVVCSGSNSEHCL